MSIKISLFSKLADFSDLESIWQIIQIIWQPKGIRWQQVATRQLWT